MLRKSIKVVRRFKNSIQQLLKELQSYTYNKYMVFQKSMFKYYKNSKIEIKH